jgi:hypothetical protein
VLKQAMTTRVFNIVESFILSIAPSKLHLRALPMGTEGVVQGSVCHLTPKVSNKNVEMLTAKKAKTMSATFPGRT